MRPYGLAPDFERAVVALACSRPKFWGRVGYAIDPAALAAPASRLAIEAARAVAAKAGRGPGSTLIVMQRLHSWRREGKVTAAQVREVAEAFDDAEDAGFPDEELAIAELADVLRSELREQAVRRAVDAHGKRADLSAVVELENAARRIGSVDTSVGVVVGDDSFEDIRELRMLDRLGTGILELDAALDGGHQRGGLAMVVADSGGGKSMFLSHQAGVAYLAGRTVACATLELPRPIWQARVISCITGVPITAILDGEDGMGRAREALAQVNGGAMCVQQFPERGTTVDDLKRWVADVEECLGKRVELLIVDYVDKMSVPPRANREVGTYEAGRELCERLRDYAEERRLWLWTGSQATRQKNPGKRLDLGDTSESMGKVRTADLWVSLNVSEDQEEVSFFIGKHRTVRGRVTVGPLPTEFSVGRVAPILAGEP